MASKAKVYIVNHEYQADHKVFFVDLEYQQKNIELISPGVLVDQEYQADVKGFHRQAGISNSHKDLEKEFSEIVFSGSDIR